MTFYVKKTRDAEIEGPFTIEKINELVRQRQLVFKSLAVPDACQNPEAVNQIPKKQWLKLADIPGFEPHPEDERNYISFGLVILIGVAIAVVIGLIKVNGILRDIH